MTITQGDVSTMLVEGYRDRLREKNAALNSELITLSAQVQAGFEAFDDAVALACEPQRKKLQKALDGLNAFFGTSSKTATTLRQLHKQTENIHFSHDQSTRYNFTVEKLTFWWLADVFGFRYPCNLDSFHVRPSPTDARRHHELNTTHLVLPWPIADHSMNLRDSYSHSPFGMAAVEIKKTPELIALASELQEIVRQYNVISSEIKKNEESINNPEEITRQVTARLTQKSLASSDMAFMKSILDSVDKPISFIGVDNE